MDASLDSPFAPAGPERLAALRAELVRQGLDGVLVPRADEHQGEYVAPYAQRLAWLTGFTGSAGVAVVLAERAAIFIDGRYTLQASQEVDTARFEPLHLVESPPSRWLAEVLGAGARIGYDPWLHTVDQVGHLQAACEKAGAVLVPVNANPVDAVWHDRPAAPGSTVVAHAVGHAGRSCADKRAEIAAALRADKVDAAVLTDPAAVAWLLNLRGEDVAYTPLPLAFAIAHADATVDLFLDHGRLAPGVAEILGDPVHIRPPGGLAAALAALGEGGRRVRVDAQVAPAAVVDALAAAGARVDRGQDPTALPKACKNAVELDGARRAHRRDGAALVRFLAFLAREAPGDGLDELSAAERLEQFRRDGALFRGLSFPTISGAGANGAIVHYRASRASNRRLEAGQLYLVDSGAQYLDGTTDVTRTVAIGTPGAEERHRFTLVLKGHIGVATARFPTGTTGSQLDVLARRFLWQEGLDYDHGTGHGVGSYLSVHEGPQRISKVGSTVALRPGMILSNEPGYYKAGGYGIRIENLQAVVDVAPPETAERTVLGFEPLTLVPIDRTLIEVELLTAEERGWLDAYHARVRAEIAPLVDDEARAWLEQATAALG
ncbi:MAG: aminopeptidase P family protein [Magnetospirillum sp.]|nr:aminopeptidase P family protein [Magnetospirillum sp.]